jgi:hypothetical protein
MARGKDVLSMLIPQGGWVITGDEYEGIQFIECDPISKTDFENGFAAADVWLAEQENLAQAKKNTALSKLESLGLDIDDLKVLGLG